MNYCGGKFRQGKAIAQFVAYNIRQGQPYYELFCGAMGSGVAVISELHGQNIRPSAFVFCDLHPALINMWIALLNGWEPPDTISELEYRNLRNKQDSHDPLVAYAGYALSFGGSWFGTYARTQRGKKDDPNHGLRAKIATLKKAKILRACSPEPVFMTRSYLATEGLQGAVIYLDPPYFGRTNPYWTKPIDHGEFWKFATRLSEHNKVIVTEFVAPSDWITVYNWGDTVIRHTELNESDGTSERIFVHQSQI